MTSNTTTVASGGTGTAPPRGRGIGPVLRGKNMSVLREVALLPVLIVLIIVGAVVSPAFLSVSNFAGIGQQSAALGVVVVGESLILMIGGMDLSLEGTYGLAPMVAAWLIVPVSAYGDGTNLSPYLGILILVAVGAVIGLINGFLIVKGRLNGEPDRLNLRRLNNQHLAFSAGPHFCIGNQLARLEGQVAILKLVQRYPKMKLAGPKPEWADTFGFRGLKGLSVVF